MESLFLASPDHLQVAQAMRRTEILALGGSEELVAAVLRTRLGKDTRYAAFWRTVVSFPVRTTDELDLAQVGPIIDFVYGIRYERIPLGTVATPSFLEPPEPAFSMKGRTLASMLRRVEQWHKDLGIAAMPRVSWTPSRHRRLIVPERPVDESKPILVWEFVELTNSQELQIEGRSLRHCVASYAHACSFGRSRIWSLHARVDNATRPVLTIELDPRLRAIVQARGMRNRMPSGRPLEVLKLWASRENLALAL